MTIRSYIRDYIYLRLALGQLSTCVFLNSVCLSGQDHSKMVSCYSISSVPFNVVWFNLHDTQSWVDVRSVLSGFLFTRLMPL